MAVSWPALLPVSPWFGTLHPQQHDKWRETCECICQDEFGSVSAATLNRFGYRADDDITDDDIYLHSLGKVLNCPIQKSSPPKHQTGNPKIRFTFRTSASSPVFLVKSSLIFTQGLPLTEASLMTIFIALLFSFLPLEAL